MVTHSKKIAQTYSDNIIQIHDGKNLELGRRGMKGIIELNLWQMISAYVFVVILLVIIKLKGISREKELLISSVRMTIQLILTGYILVYIFNSPSPVYTILIIAAMEAFAIYNIIKRTKSKLSKDLKIIISLSMLAGTLSCIFYFLLIVVRISPWYSPQYFIPISGMLIGNSMTGISLGLNRLVDGIKENKNLVEGALMLRATPKIASNQIVNNAFDSAILPTINSMVGMGIVFFTWDDDRTNIIWNFSCYSNKLSNCNYAWNPWQCLLNGNSLCSIRI